MELSKTAYVILGMLRMGKRTGYEIKALVDRSTRFFWAASYGQIYPELKRLETAGWSTGRTPRPAIGAGASTSSRQPARRPSTPGSRPGRPLHFELRHEGVLRYFFSDALPDRGAHGAAARDPRRARARTR